jgi:hypothetical protein
MDYFDKIIKLSKEPSEKKRFSKQQLSFLNYAELRTYSFLFRKIKNSIHYRVKKSKLKARNQ